MAPLGPLGAGVRRGDLHELGRDRRRVGAGLQLVLEQAGVALAAFVVVLGAFGQRLTDAHHHATFDLTAVHHRISNPKANPGDWRDYSRDATLRSVEQSLTRLGTDRLDIAFVHDCDDDPGAALDGALPALAELKAQGVVGALGVGSNFAATHLALLREAELDVLMVAGRFTLLDQSAAPDLFPLCRQRGTQVELASPFNSGILATGPDDPATRFDYQPPDAATRAKVRAIQKACAAHDVTLKRAALHYSAAHPAVTRLVLGLTAPAGLRSNLADLSAPVPAALWPALAALGIPAPTEQP